MAKEGVEFSKALSEAQRLGYAEPDPSNDVNGTDAAYKLAILATLAFKADVRPQNVYREGISKLDARDFQYAKELGYAIKLLAIARCNDGEVQARVHPSFIKQDEQLAKVDGVFNAIQIEGDLMGKVLLYGRGAGTKPTASAVLADVLDVARNIRRGAPIRPALEIDSSKRIRPMAQISTKHYIRMSVEDSPGVLGRIAKVLGDRNISISSVIQKETDFATKTAEIVIMTHEALEDSVQNALKTLKRSPVSASLRVSLILQKLLLLSFLLI
jgi:homoserine dehydrogenase